MCWAYKNVQSNMSYGKICLFFCRNHINIKCFLNSRKLNQSLRLDVICFTGSISWLNASVPAISVMKLQVNSTSGHGNNFNKLRLQHYGYHFGDNICKCIFFDRNLHILTQISLKLIHKALINNMSLMVLMTAWHQAGEQPSPKPKVP